ncbi:MAG: ABC transporter substrate-binding protein [Clostridia bacterium]|jgi:polar amino acid transport system substrate-binding protein|nr:ABC transporter substrate-binding protein [Clostridia bacterium]
MFGKKSLFLTIALLLTLSLALIGCAQDVVENGAELDGNDTSHTGDAVEGDGSLDRVLAAGKITVVGSGGYPPFNFFNENDELVGFDVDTGSAIAERLGVELNYVTGEWAGLIEGLRAGRYDGILGSMAITEERLERVNFTIPYYYSGAQLIVRKDSGITDPSEMEGKKIAIATGTTFEDDVEALGATAALYDDDNLTLSELINGRVDGVITDRLVGMGAMREIRGGDGLIMVGELLRTEEMAIAVNKNDVELLEKLNEILEEMHADGTLTEISKRWHEGEDITVK